MRTGYMTAGNSRAAGDLRSIALSVKLKLLSRRLSSFSTYLLCLLTPSTTKFCRGKVSKVLWVKSPTHRGVAFYSLRPNIDHSLYAGTKVACDDRLTHCDNANSSLMGGITVCRLTLPNKQSVLFWSQTVEFHSSKYLLFYINL